MIYHITTAIYLLSTKKEIKKIKLNKNQIKTNKKNKKNVRV